MSLLENIKVSLRISHNKLDTEIQAWIHACISDLKRVGILENVAEDEENKLVVQAIKTYCHMQNTTDNNKYVRYNESYMYQIDVLRKSKNYGYKDEVN